MKTYDVYVQRCFTSYVAVQANSADDAEELVRNMLNAKMIDPSQWDESDFIESGEDMVIEEGGHA